MCNRYFQPPREKINTRRLLDAPATYLPGDVFPRGRGGFIRPRGNAALELIVGQWALVPHFAKSPKLAYSTNNARSETVATASSYRDAWQTGQRCVIPSSAFWEPCWESGRNEWWRFQRMDGQPFALAGIYNPWTDRATGEIVDSYTMLTQNADNHPLMRRMHKPDPTLAADKQDKRSVVIIEEADVEQWLLGSEADARALIRLSPVEIFDAQPEPGQPAR